MNKRTVSIVITALIIGTLIVMMVKSNIETAEPIDTVFAGADSTTIEYKPGLEKGNTPPDFELSTLSGDMVKLTDYKGKKLFLISGRRGVVRARRKCHICKIIMQKIRILRT